MLARDLAVALDPALVMVEAGLDSDQWQADLLRSRAARTLLLCSRQSGKSTTTAALALHEALYHAPALVLLLSPSLRQSGELFRKVVDFYRLFGETAPATAESALRLDLRNGSRIVSLPGQESTIRGYSGVSLLVIDEAARVEDALYFSVRPMLAVSGGRLVALTTPFGRRGFFWEAWSNGAPEWQRVKVTARDCPRIPPSFLDEERKALGPYWYSQEYECTFNETEDQLFSFAVIDQAFTSEVAPLFPR